MSLFRQLLSDDLQKFSGRLPGLFGSEGSNQTRNFFQFSHTNMQIP